jgi:hypothetical protein
MAWSGTVGSKFLERLHYAMRRKNLVLKPVHDHIDSHIIFDKIWFSRFKSEITTF